MAHVDQKLNAVFVALSERDKDAMRLLMADEGLPAATILRQLLRAEAERRIENAALSGEDGE